MLLRMGLRVTQIKSGFFLNLFSLYYKTEISMHSQRLTHFEAMASQNSIKHFPRNYYSAVISDLLWAWLSFLCA